MDWIPIQSEVEHVSSYLAIQKMRYRDILDYRIELDKGILNETILKLTLQPLVENALYHGIKNKRNGGKITVRVKKAGSDLILIEVEDNGVGFSPDKLAAIQAAMTEDESEISMKGSGFGLDNVNKRIKLYYGRQYGLTVQSQFLTGTCVTVAIPVQEAPERQMEIERVP
jgi:two-component system sensor histidine kinase YesM